MNSILTLFGPVNTYSRYRSFIQDMVCHALLHVRSPLTIVGPIIRITPDEVHVNDVGFLDTIYAPSMIRRDKYGHQLRSLRVPGGLGTTTDHDLHKVRRESLTPFFSKKNIQYMEGLITDKVDQLKQLISTHAARDTPVNLSDVFFAFSNE